MNLKSHLDSYYLGKIDDTDLMILKIEFGKEIQSLQKSIDSTIITNPSFKLGITKSDQYNLLNISYEEE